MDDHRYLKEIRQASPYILVYALFWACTYLKIYWSYFSIKPFQYIGISDVVSQVADQLFFACLSFIAITLMGTFLPAPKTSEQNQLREVQSLKITVPLVLMLAGGIFYLFKDDYIYSGAALGVVMAVARSISYLEVYKHSFSSSAVRVAIAAFTISFPVWSIFSAYTDSHDILNEKRKQPMIHQASGSCSVPCMLIGKIGDYYAVKDNNKRILMISSDKMNDFEIYTFDFGK